MQDDYMHPDLSKYLEEHEDFLFDRASHPEMDELFTKSWEWEEAMRNADELAFFKGMKLYYKNWWD
jgi:hypothetical protein